MCNEKNIDNIKRLYQKYLNIEDYILVKYVLTKKITIDISCKINHKIGNNYEVKYFKHKYSKHFKKVDDVHYLKKLIKKYNIHSRYIFQCNFEKESDYFHVLKYYLKLRDKNKKVYDFSHRKYVYYESYIFNMKTIQKIIRKNFMNIYEYLYKNDYIKNKSLTLYYLLLNNENEHFMKLYKNHKVDISHKVINLVIIRNNFPFFSMLMKDKKINIAILTTHIRYIVMADNIEMLKLIYDNFDEKQIDMLLHTSRIINFTKILNVKCLEYLMSRNFTFIDEVYTMALDSPCTDKDDFIYDFLSYGIVKNHNILHNILLLEKAIMRNSYSIVRLLIQCNCARNLQTDYYSCVNGNVEIIKLLVKYDYFFNKKDNLAGLYRLAKIYNRRPELQKKYIQCIEYLESI